MSDIKSGFLHELFENQVDLQPDSPALIFEIQKGLQEISYAELESYSNQLARYLRLLGAGPGTFIGLYFEKSAHPIVAILASLKAGSAYIPIDPAFPIERIRHIVTETQPILVLTETDLKAKLGEFYQGKTLVVDAPPKEISQQSTARLLREETGLKPDDLCYLIYTSGTTGHPKGVMTEHRNAFQYVLAFNEICRTTPSDRVYQGFSLGFDGSVEEIWMAFSNGSALVVGDKTTPRFGNDLGLFLTQMKVSYFSTVPTLLSTLTEPIPSLRTLVVSGEICPPELVNRWAHAGLSMYNVYGPTEATVNTSAARCIQGRPVTIGRPLKGYDIYILDSEMMPVPYGEKGELYVGGCTLARGYFNQPKLTAERFFNLTSEMRLYRTGDLVRFNQEGELEFFGRIDNQVKIRGYRVELAEIESILLEVDRIQSACVKLFEREGLQELAAYVVIETPTLPLNRAEVLAKLESRLPAYMIPGYLDVVSEFATLTSGKIDRTKLPTPVSPLVRNRERIDPETDLQAKIAAIWGPLFGIQKVSIEDDFFTDLGGHSLVAAQMVTKLRTETQKRVTVRDAYSFPTIRKLANHIDSLESLESSPTAKEETRGASFKIAMLQAISMFLLYGLGATPFCILYFLGQNWIMGNLSLPKLLGLSGALVLLTWPLFLTFSILAKWLIIGRYRPGEYPLWGSYYFRWWLVSRIQAMSGAGVLAGTPLMSVYFRLMGAKVGRFCTLDTSLCSIWDLVTIGNETSIGADTQLLGYRVEDGKLLLGQVKIGHRCFIGIHSALGLNVKMGDDARLDDQSLLPDGSVIHKGESKRGSPAQTTPVQVPSLSTTQRNSLKTFLFGLLHFISQEIMGLVLLIPGLLLLGAWYFTFDLNTPAGIAFLVALVPIGFILYCLFIPLLKKIILRKAHPGTYSVESLFYVRKRLVDSLMKFSRTFLLPLYTTLYLPPWLRLLGAKIGPRAELSTVWSFSPDLVDIGAESFFADGSIIGGNRIYRGTFEIGINRIGNRSFVGNSAILPVGIGLGHRCLLGVQSIPPTGVSCTPDGSEWLGSPSFSLPHRKKIDHFSDSETFHPTKKLYLQRAVIDALRILIPNYTFFSAALMALTAYQFLYLRFGLTIILLSSPFITFFLGLYGVFVVVLLKKSVMGTFKPEIKPLWSKYIWLNEMINGAYESIMAPAIAPFLGTPFIAFFLRLIGCKVGKNAFIETTLFSEFDLVEIGDHTALNLGAVIQTHLFEDRVMKSSHLKIGNRCSVGNMAVILYDSEMQEGSSLGSLSLLMKGETLPPLSRWYGTPTIQELPLLQEPSQKKATKIRKADIPGLKTTSKQKKRDEVLPQLH